MQGKAELSKKIVDFSYIIIDKICTFFLLVQIVVISYIVFGRYVLNNSPAWGEELSLFCMVWYGMLSIVLGIVTDSHIKMTVIDFILPQKVIKYIDLFNYILIMAFSVFMIVEGWKLTEMTIKNMMPGMKISSAWLYVSVPASFLFIAITSYRKARELLS